jgi:hypothetical protein
MEEFLLFSCSQHGGMSALILLTMWINVCSLPAHCMEKYLLSSCSLYGEIPALILLTVWRNVCSLSAHGMEKYMLSCCSLYEGTVSLLSSCSLYGSSLILLSLYGGMSAPFLLTECRNTCSHRVHCVEKSLLSSCSLRGEMPAIILLPVWRNVCSSSCFLHGEIPTLILLTVWKNLWYLPAQCMEKYMLSSRLLFGGISALSCSLHGEIPALILGRNIRSLPAHSTWRKYLL